MKPDRDDLLGRLTQAICVGVDSDTRCCGNCGPLKNQAREVLRALREPTDAMVATGEPVVFEHMAESTDWTLDAVRDGWRAMMDAAAKECT